ncbi:MAG: LLM class F420-dependent oxidoreductase [Legionellales bacterium]|nr:LLM class F420-dependent oxidoreductase [Legionellales bacterium]HCU89655.1 LLM class F420-dependent oxidoreductase [Gammaproteobacteria bacterium]|tara:strand:- start:169 stop:1221 length:1053 start_codon:yes stop_codon:yes gene_type:complete
MRITTTIPQHNLRAVPSAAIAIERAGYDGITTLENQHDPFMPLGVAAINTERIELATGIAISFLRSPMSAANLTWDLCEASGGRFTLGLGTQIKAHNEKRFSVPWSPPAPRMREYIGALRAIWRSWKYGERLNFQGKHYQFTLMIPNFVPEGSGLKLPAVTLAAVGPSMLKLSGEVADGVRLHPFCTRKYLTETVMPCLEAGLKKSARLRQNFEISGGGFIATGATDEAVAMATEWARYRVAFYGSTPAYWPVLEAHDAGDLGRKLNRLTKGGQWAKLSAEVPDDILQLFAAIGRHDQIASQIKQRFGGLTDTVLASTSSQVSADLPPDLIADIQRIETPFSNFETESKM